MKTKKLKHRCRIWIWIPASQTQPQCKPGEWHPLAEIVANDSFELNRKLDKPLPGGKTTAREYYLNDSILAGDGHQAFRHEFLKA